MKFSYREECCMNVDNVYWYYYTTTLYCTALQDKIFYELSK